MLLLDFDGDKIFISFDPLLISGVMTKEDGSPLDIVVSPLEGLNAPTVEITPATMYEVDKRSMDNRTGLYTDMATFYMNYYYHVSYVSREFLARIQDPKVSLAELYAQFNEYFPKEKVDVTLFTRAFAKRRVEELRVVKLTELEKAITIARIASAGEIDFPKHGMRFPMPKSVFTKKRAVWHKCPNRVLLESELAKKQECGWGAKEYYIPNGISGITVVDFKTPMQVLSNHVYDKMKAMDSKLTASGSLRLIEAIIKEQKESLEVTAYSVQLKGIYDEYVAGTNEIRAMQNSVQLPEKVIGEIYSKFYNKMANKTASFANRKALAEACLSICAGTKSDNFAFVCAFDGILEILSERATQTIRVAEIDVPNYVSGITVALEGKVASYTSTCGVIETIELPIILSPGEYKVIDTLNKRYVTFGKHLTREEVANHLESARRVTSKEHHVKLVVDRQYKVGITGLSHTDIVGFNATKANELIVKNNNTIMFKEYTFLNEKGIKSVGVGVWVGDIRVGKLSSLDENQVTDESMVRFKSLYNSPFKIDVVSDSLYRKTATTDANGNTVKVVDYSKPSNGFNAVVTVASMSPISYVLDKIHNTCDLNQWYWNVEWKKFSELGFEFLGVEIGQAIKGRTIGRVQLRQNGVVFQADVTYVGGSIGLALGSFSDGYNLYSVEDIYRTKRELLAQILRCVAYSYKKATYVEPVVVKSDERIEWEQQMQAKQEAYMVEMERRKEEKQARIIAEREERIKEVVRKQNEEFKAKCELKGKEVQAQRNAEFQAQWEERNLAKKNKKSNK